MSALLFLVLVGHAVIWRAKGADILLRSLNEGEEGITKRLILAIVFQLSLAIWFIFSARKVLSTRSLLVCVLLISVATGISSMHVKEVLADLTYNPFR